MSFKHSSNDSNNHQPAKPIINGGVGSDSNINYASPCPKKITPTRIVNQVNHGVRLESMEAATKGLTIEPNTFLQNNDSDSGIWTTETVEKQEPHQLESG
jgi:hypothetical protein